MPPKLHGSLPRSLSRLTTKTAVIAASEGIGVFCCPSCTIWRRSLSGATTGRHRRLQNAPASKTTAPRHGRRYATSPVVNVTRNIPPRFKELHSALEGVGEAAATHVNLSRLHLAQRGLESEKPVIRVAGML